MDCGTIMRYKCRRSLVGFTLVELLVVISIIALLLSVMMPALSKARSQAVMLLCKHNLKDVGVMMSAYSAANNGRLPSSSRFGYRWWDLLGEYYNRKNVSVGQAGSKYDNQLLMCPLEYRKHKKSLATNNALGAYAMYTLNGFFGCPANEDGTPSPSFKKYWWNKVEDIIQPATLPLFWDRNSDSYILGSEEFGLPHPAIYKYGWANGKRQLRKTNLDGPAANHLKNINYLFADFHVESKGLWPYQDTMQNPQPATYYQRLFHPKRNLSILPSYP